MFVCLAIATRLFANVRVGSEVFVVLLTDNVVFRMLEFAILFIVL